MVGVASWLAALGISLPGGTPIETYVGYQFFPRILQFDNYSCYARSVQAVLTHFGYSVSYKSIVRELRTGVDGTHETPAVKFLRKQGLRVGVRRHMTMRDLHDALARDAVVLAYLDGDHIGVVYGMGKSYVHLADPSLVRTRLGKIPRQQFRQRWDRSGLTVSG
ncbi:MAG: hypothetical protein H0U59_00550 [Gemmatimonadaceae bacterium]|nr:hypothetical protein [Gemmatimonadaceae bacterium]